MCPAHTLRANIDYGFYEAKTTFGRIGVRSGSTRATSTNKELAREQANAPKSRRVVTTVAATVVVALAMRPPWQKERRRNASSPARSLYRKQHHPGRSGQATGGTQVSFGEFGIQALTPPT